MNLQSWRKALEEAAGEFDAATTRSALSAAAKRLMRAKAELNEVKAPAART